MKTEKPEKTNSKKQTLNEMSLNALNGSDNFYKY